MAHQAFLDGLRAIAALYVVLFHALRQVEDTGAVFSPAPKRFCALFGFGHQAVDLFIVISGFCLMLPILKNNGYLKGSYGQFLKKRAQRILPPYFLAIALTLLSIFTLIGAKTGTVWDRSVPVTTWGLIAHLTMLQDAFRGTAFQINSAFWSISVEWRIYFVFPLLVLLFRKIGAIKTALLALLASYVLICVLSHTTLNCDPKLGVGIMPQYLGLFTLGMLGASICYAQDSLCVRLRERFAWRTFWLASLAVGILLVRVPIAYGFRLPLAISDLAFGLSAMALLIAASRSETSRLARTLGWRPLAFIGTFAYSLYLIHMPIQQIFWQYVLPPLHKSPLLVFALQSTLGTGTILLVSYGFYLFAERPFLKPTKRPALPNGGQLSLV